LFCFLNSGISLLIPEGALAPTQQELIYLGICREESMKPRLSEKSTMLSELVFIGPKELTLLKPVIVTLEHSAFNVNSDWNITLHSAHNSFDEQADWVLDKLRFVSFEKKSLFFNFLSNYSNQIKTKKKKLNYLERYKRHSRV
jgi:hypothetical protein